MRMIDLETKRGSYRVAVGVVAVTPIGGQMISRACWDDENGHHEIEGVEAVLPRVVKMIEEGN